MSDIDVFGELQQIWFDLGLEAARFERRRQRSDFARFDLILVMDDENHRDALALAPPAGHQRVRRLLEFSSQVGDEVPDPYYGDAAGFETVLDLIEEACRGLLAEVCRISAASH